jgi:hypothetical protein
MALQDPASGPTRPTSDKSAGISVAEAVRRWIDARPVVQEALAQGLVNLSALARQIIQETGLKGEEAVLVACRRHQRRLEPRGTDETVRRVLGGSKLEIRTRVGVLTARPHWQVFSRLEPVVRHAGASNHPIHVIRGSEALTVITDEAVLDETITALGEENILKRRTGLVELNLRSPEVVEDVQGILAFITSALSSRGINMVDVISCHKDNMFLVKEEDLYKAMETLRSLTDK